MRIGVRCGGALWRMARWAATAIGGYLALATVLWVGLQWSAMAGTVLVAVAGVVVAGWAVRRRKRNRRKKE